MGCYGGHMHGLPSTAGFLVRGLLRRRAGLHNGSIPHIEHEFSGIRVQEDWLDAYCALTGATRTAHLPNMVPQLIAGPMHAAVLTAAEMPLKTLGLVHVGQKIHRLAPLPLDGEYRLKTWVEGHRVAKRGAEFDLHTRLFLGGSEVWSGTTTILGRGPWGDKTLPSTEEPAPITWGDVTEWSVPASIGRQWWRVCGDPNPIHLHPLLAKPLGFKRAIAHGTWLLARAIASLDDPDQVSCSFRRPVFLPSQVDFMSASSSFRIQDSRTTKLHVAGTFGAV